MKFMTVFIWIAAICNAAAQTFIPYRSGEWWGYCTPDKKMVITPKYERAQWFSEGLAAVAYGCNTDCYDEYDGLWAYIDEKGNEVISAQFETVSPFNKGLAWVQKNGVWHQINRKGEVVNTVNEPTCKGCIPDKMKAEIFAIKLPDGFQEEHRQNQFLGYINNNQKYWDDPVTMLFIPIETIVEKGPQADYPYVRVSNRLYGRLVYDAGEIAKPSLVYLTLKNNEITVEKTFPLGNEDYSEEVSVNIQIPEYDKAKPYIERTRNNPDKEKLLIAITVKIPMDSITQNIFFNILAKGICFYESEYGVPLLENFSGFLELTKPAWQEDLLNTMVYELHKVAAALKEQGELKKNKPVAESNNSFNGKMLHVLENATRQEVFDFLKYVSAKPFKYMGKPYAFAEAYAGWVEGGPPKTEGQ